MAKTAKRKKAKSVSKKPRAAKKVKKTAAKKAPAKKKPAKKTKAKSKKTPLRMVTLKSDHKRKIKLPQPSAEDIRVMDETQPVMPIVSVLGSD